MESFSFSVRARRGPDCGTRLAEMSGGSRHWDGSSSVKVQIMEIIIVLLVIMWLLGMLTSTTLGGFLHLLLVVALAIVVVRALQGRRAV